MGTEERTANPVSTQATTAPADTPPTPITLEELRGITRGVETLSQRIELFRLALLDAMADPTLSRDPRRPVQEMLEVYDAALEIRATAAELAASWLGGRED